MGAGGEGGGGGVFRGRCIGIHTILFIAAVCSDFYCMAANIIISNLKRGERRETHRERQSHTHTQSLQYIIAGCLTFFMDVHVQLFISVIKTGGFPDHG